LIRLRAAHEKWRSETGDLGLMPEAELMERVRPGGIWNTTRDPEMTISGGQATISCSTEGASIAYRTKTGNRTGRWLLYLRPVALTAGQTIEAKACRLGFKDSQMVAANSN
jgi:N-sulfoglucosamine sulfohydrolase